MLCVLILYMSGGTYNLKSIPNNRFLTNFSWQFYLLSEFLPEICWEEVAEVDVWASYIIHILDVNVIRGGGIYR